MFSPIARDHNYCFDLSFPGLEVTPKTQELLARHAKAFIQERITNVDAFIAENGTLSGFRDPLLFGTLNEVHYQRRLGELATYVGNKVNCRHPDLQFTWKGVTPGVEITVRLDEVNGSKVVHTLHEVNAWLETKKEEQGAFHTKVTPSLFVYGSNRTGDTTHHGSSPVVTVRLGGELRECKPVADELALFLGQSRYFMLQGDHMLVMHNPRS